MKSILFCLLALLPLAGFGQDANVTQKIAEGEAVAKTLSAEARTVSIKIGELAISGNLPNDKSAIDEMKKLVAQLEEINARLATLETSMSALKEWAAGKDKSEAKKEKALQDLQKIKFSNYVQFQYRDTDQAGKAQHSFEVRRVRLGASMDINPNASLKVSYDFAGGTDRTQGELKDVVLTYKPGQEGLALVGGQFALPLGYENTASNSALEFPERSTANRTMFNDERLRGVMFQQKLEGGTTVYAGIANSLTTKDKEQSGLAPGTGGQLAGFGGFRYKKDDVEAGIGYFFGKRPEFTSGGTSPEVDRRFLIADAQINNIFAQGAYLRSELMLGHDRVPSSTGAPAKIAHDMTGYHLTLGYKANKKSELFTRLALFDPNDESNGDAIREYGLGWRYGLGSGASMTLSHEIFEDNSVSNSPYGVSTLRVQFKF